MFICSFSHTYRTYIELIYTGLEYTGRIYRGVVGYIRVSACIQVVSFDTNSTLIVSCYINSFLPICCGATYMVRCNITYGALQHDTEWCTAVWSMLHCNQAIIEQDRNIDFVSLCFQRLSILFHFISFYPLYAALHTTTSMRRGEPSNIPQRTQIMTIYFSIYLALTTVGSGVLLGFGICWVTGLLSVRIGWWISR